MKRDISLPCAPDGSDSEKDSQKVKKPSMSGVEPSTEETDTQLRDPVGGWWVVVMTICSIIAY